jgi:2,3-bisphosphoglycerate-independent phosphoglycerate mutase
MASPPAASPDGLIRGVATCFGLDLIDVPGLTGEYNTVLEDRAGYVLEAHDTYDFVFVQFRPRHRLT